MINLKTDLTASSETLEQAHRLFSELTQDPMAGWLNLPDALGSSSPRAAEYTKLKTAAKHIQETSDFLVCIGIGGSYLGHKALIEALAPVSKTKILYAGNSLSPLALQSVLDKIGDHDFSINVISKSGTTLEPALAFRVLKAKLIEKYGEIEAAKRIYTTTDATKGALHDEAIAKNYETFVIPDDVGGRFSVFTPVGLLPLAVAGIDTDALLTGASSDNTEKAIEYAVLRHKLRLNSYDTEILATFEPQLKYIAEWWKQLFGESEGKANGGIFPASVVYSTDLHSLGQYLQQGRKNLFETFLSFKAQPGLEKIKVPETSDNLDELNYLKDHNLAEICKIAETATVSAHKKQRPVFELELDDLSEKSLGELLYFFELACSVSAKLQGVNPFDQPGVEQYKSEMFSLLKAPNN